MITVDLMSISKNTLLQFQLLCPTDKMVELETSVELTPADFLVSIPGHVTVMKVENNSIIPILNAIFDFKNADQEQAIKDLLNSKGVHAWLDSDPVVPDGWGITEITADEIEEGSFFIDDETGEKHDGFYAFKENWEPEGYLGPYDDLKEAIGAAKEFDLDNLINED
jgi:hypothetical protein